MNPVVHFEMPAEDKKRVEEFYTKVFGWKMNQTGEEMGNYLVAQTTEVDDKNMPINPGAINGGFFQKEDNAETIPHIIISVGDLKVQMDAVKSAGGEIIGEPIDIPTVGNFVMFKDTEGNRVGMLQPTNK